ncbi:MAG: hypothetical protein NZ874_04450 [Fimbriimonadales bacterium]|nr:hypothetical protein [Fimbriimonadales bacterium]
MRNTMLFGLLTFGVAVLASAQVREVWRYEFVPPQEELSARLERVVRLADGGVMLLGWVDTTLNGQDALAVRLRPNGTVAWVYQHDGAGFDDAFVDAVEAFNNQVWLLGRFTDANGYLQTQVHKLTPAGTPVSTQTMLNPPMTHLRPLRFGYYDTLILFAESVSASGESQLRLFDSWQLSEYYNYPFRPWGVSYSPDSLQTQSVVGGTTASLANLTDVSLLFFYDFFARYASPFGGFDIPLVIAQRTAGQSPDGYYVGVVSEGRFTGDDAVLLFYRPFSLGWGYRYSYQLHDDSPESLAVDPQGRAHLLVRTILWRDEPFERHTLRLLRFSVQGALQQDVELEIGQTRLVSGLLRINAAGQRFMAVSNPSFVARLDTNGRYLWQVQMPMVFYDLLAEPDGSVIAAGERILYNEAQYEVARRLAAVKYAPNGDLNSDGCINDADLLGVLLAFGQQGADLIADLNGDGVVNDADLITVLFAFGSGC